MADGYRGGALNLAARLCSLAGPGEILASETVLQLARAMEGIRYGERRLERVKGLAKPVTAVEVLPADRPRPPLGPAAAPADGAPPPHSAEASGSEPSCATRPRSASVRCSSSPAQDRAPREIKPQLRRIRLAVGQGRGPASGERGRGPRRCSATRSGSATSSDKTLERIDPKTRKLVHPFLSIAERDREHGRWARRVWVVDATDARAAADRSRSTRRSTGSRCRRSTGDIDFTAPTEAVVGAGSVWVAEANKVFRDRSRGSFASSRRSTCRRPTCSPSATARSGSAAATSRRSARSTRHQPGREDCQTCATSSLRLAVGGGFVWATVTPDDTLWKIDLNGTLEKTLDVGAGDVAYFVGCRLGRRERLAAAHRPAHGRDHSVPRRRPSVGPGSGRRRCSSSRRDRARRSSRAARRGQGRYLQPRRELLDDTDPAHAYPAPHFRVQFDYATGAQLLNYRGRRLRGLSSSPRWPRRCRPCRTAAASTRSASGPVSGSRRRRTRRSLQRPSGTRSSGRSPTASGPRRPGYSAVSDIVGAGVPRGESAARLGDRGSGRRAAHPAGRPCPVTSSHGSRCPSLQPFRSGRRS